MSKNYLGIYGETIYSRNDDIHDAVEHMLKYVGLNPEPQTIIEPRDDSPPRYNFTNNTIYLPHSLQRAKPWFTKSIIGHEIGHPAHCPKTLNWHLFFQGAAMKAGVQEPPIAANIFEDIIVNDWNMVDTPWKKVFRKFVKKDYTLQKIKRKNGFHVLYTQMYHRVRELEGKPVKLEGPDMLVYNILFHDTRPIHVRAIEYFSLVAKYFNEKIDYNDESEHYYHCFPILGDGDGDGEEMEEWRQMMRGLGKRIVGEIIDKEGQKFNDPGSRKLVKELCNIIALTEIMAVEDEGKSVGKKLTGPKEEQIWRTNDRVKDLNIKKTIARYGGAIIPGVTTLKLVQGERKISEGTGTATMFLLLDMSDSMEPYYGRIAGIVYPSIKIAQRRRDRIGIMRFASRPDYIHPIDKDYGGASRDFEAQSMGGGTTISTAFEEILDITKKTGRKPTVIVVSDGEFMPSDTSTVINNMGELKKLGGITSFCFVCNEAAYETNHYIKPTYKAFCKSDNMDIYKMHEVGALRKMIRRVK